MAKNETNKKVKNKARESPNFYGRGRFGQLREFKANGFKTFGEKRQI